MAAFYDPWDARYNRPIVGGRVTNPITGEVEVAGEMFVAGPPSIQVIWVNLCLSSTSSGWGTIAASLNCTIDDALIQIAQQVKEGLYSIVSLNASAYSLTIMCKSTTTGEEIRQNIHTLRHNLHGDRDEEQELPNLSDGTIPAASEVTGGPSSGSPELEENNIS